jgi:colanic acid/amylovoran biosynthesis glycosyltransferase
MFDAEGPLKSAVKSSMQREPLIVAHASSCAMASTSDLIEACCILQRRHCVFRCEIYGDAIYEQQMRALIENSGLEENVKYLPISPRMRESVARASVFAAIAEANHSDISAMRRDLFSLREAMILGTPCLVTDYSAGAEYIHDEETGIVEPRNYPEALAISLQRLLSDASLRTRLAKEARLIADTLSKKALLQPS